MSGIDTSGNLRIVQACLDDRQWKLSFLEEFCRNFNIGGAKSRILRNPPSGNHSALHIHRNRLNGRDPVSGIDKSSNLRIVQACLGNRQWKLSLYDKFCRN